jgi:hypothetical protein
MNTTFGLLWADTVRAYRTKIVRISIALFRFVM